MAAVHYLLLFLAYCWVALGDHSDDHDITPACDPNNFTATPNPPLPVIPDQYMVTAELVDSARNTTIFFTEYFDELGNRARIDTTLDGLKRVTIADYDDGEVFTYTQDTCNVSPIILPQLNNRNIFVSMLFGVVSGPNGTVHIGQSSGIFSRFIKDSNAKYIGFETVRGIPSHHWQACFVNENELWLMFDIYFAPQSQWQLPFMEDLRPILLRIKGQLVQNDTVVDIDIAINYVLYQSGPDAVPDMVFQVPTGLPCKGRKPGQPLPSFPRFFSTIVELAFGSRVSVLKVSVASHWVVSL